MPAKSNSSEDPKVMDVARPGKGKIAINSRPIASPVVNDKAESNDVVTTMEPATAPVLAPSAARKVIKPLDEEMQGSDAPAEQPRTTGITVVSEDAEEAEKITTTTESEKSPENTQEQEQPAESAGMQPDPESGQEEQPAEETEGPEADEPESVDNLPTPKAGKDNPIAPEAPATDMSGAASVDELAKAAEQKRLSSEKAKQDAERDQKVQELIRSKQYHVPIKGASVKTGSRKSLFVVLAILLVGLVGYAAADYGLFGKDIKLPFEIFKEEASSSDSSASSEEASGGAAGTQPADEGGEKPEPEQEQPEPVASATPEERAQDDERKNELKNLQLELEKFFNDNGAYPEDLGELSLTEDQLTGPGGESYGYVSDTESFTLSAKLSNGTEYTIESLNQPE